MNPSRSLPLSLTGPLLPPHSNHPPSVPYLGVTLSLLFSYPCQSQIALRLVSVRPLARKHRPPAHLKFARPASFARPLRSFLVVISQGRPCGRNPLAANVRISARPIARSSRFDPHCYLSLSLLLVVLCCCKRHPSFALRHFPNFADAPPAGNSVVVAAIVSGRLGVASQDVPLLRLRFCAALVRYLEHIHILEIVAIEHNSD